MHSHLFHSTCSKAALRLAMGLSNLAQFDAALLVFQEDAQQMKPMDDAAIQL